MSVNYASGLSPYDNKGVCGLEEIEESENDVKLKTELLANLIKESKHVVVLVGAGISTSAGIPDFRGKNGVWTLEKKNIKTENQNDVSLADAKPTLTHMTIRSLALEGFVKYVISQNIDGLFMKTGLERKFISEVHGNFYLDECNHCSRRYVRSTPSPTMGLKVSDTRCPRPGRPCRGYLRDTILDWEDELPPIEFERAEIHSEKADLFICMGTTLQINPVGQMPFKKRTVRPKVVIINLQATKYDSKAELVIRSRVDNICKQLCLLLGITIQPPIDFTFNSTDKMTLWK